MNRALNVWYFGGGFAVSLIVLAASNWHAALAVFAVWILSLIVVIVRWFTAVGDGIGAAAAECKKVVEDHPIVEGEFEKRLRNSTEVIIHSPTRRRGP